jgi:hypothetical protein
MCKEYDGCCYCEKRKKEHEKLDKVYLKTLENKSMWSWNKHLDSDLVWSATGHARAELFSHLL